MPETTCAQCAGPARKKYCSRECYYRASKGTKRVEHVQAICACGKTFETRAARVTSGRGRFCSKACQYANATRPSGLTYEIRAENQGWFQEGVAGLTGPDAPGWRGDEIGYQQLHRWVRKHRGAPQACELCGTADGLIEWANKSHEYRRDLDDWLALCRFCHKSYDKDFRGAAVEKYGAANLTGRREPTCAP